MDNDALIEAPTNAAAGAVVASQLERQVATLTAEVRRIERGKPYRLKENGEIETLERLLEHPVFRRGEATFYDAASFSAFVNRFKFDSSLIFADAIGKRFTGVLDYHDAGPEGIANWDLLRALLPLRHTPSWETWAKLNNTPMPQETFAQFIEDNLPDIAEPTGASLVEIARTLEAKNSVSFESHIRADNGAHKFAYTENIEGTSRGTLTIPQEFVLVLQPFEGSNSYRVTARLRYRLAQKALSLSFLLVRIEDVLKEAFHDERQKIAAVVGETLILNGPAPVAQKPKDD